MQFQKTLPLIGYDAFVGKVKQVENFTSAQGRRYEVDGITDDTLYFRRMVPAKRPETSTLSKPTKLTRNWKNLKPKTSGPTWKDGIRPQEAYCFAWN